TIHFAVTGNHRYKTDFEVIRIGQDFTKVSMIHINKKNKLEITRILKKKVNSKATSSTVEVKLNDEIVASGTREGQQYINKYFSVTPEDFKASYFFRQKEHDTLLKLINSNGKIIQSTLNNENEAFKRLYLRK
ncbi:hypothetical protein LCGC14_2244370, partial [marine sediment metagenome]